MVKAKAKPSNVVQLRPSPEPVQQCFFHKSQVRVGTKFRTWGRLHPNQLWRVVQIKTFPKVNGVPKPQKVGRVQRLSDDVQLVNDHTGEIRVTTFASMSYSAIWWLV